MLEQKYETAFRAAGRLMVAYADKLPRRTIEDAKQYQGIFQRE